MVLQEPRADVRVPDAGLTLGHAPALFVRPARPRVGKQKRRRATAASLRRAQHSRARLFCVQRGEGPYRGVWAASSFGAAPRATRGGEDFGRSSPASRWIESFGVPGLESSMPRRDLEDGVLG